LIGDKEMAAIPPKEINRFRKGIIELENAIKNPETRESINNLIESYSRFDRGDIWAKQSYLVESLHRLCGKLGTEVMVNILNRGSSTGSWNIISQIEVEELKRFLEQLTNKYGARYQWFLDPYPDDWQRYHYSTEYVGVPPLPIISSKITTKTGKSLELRSPLNTYGSMILAQMEHLTNIEHEMEKLGVPKSIQKIMGKDKLKKIKSIVEKLLDESSPKSK
jgi:hypothetical protein